ncbi:4Fe-4S binding protein [Svornostia abyssi]|uniref:ferredoxin--NADP(+) reductase n=1 Tax=Svornostia abyssi TaxID=2898438 RepID=A0ABY5PKQ6_9ACTN|nr:4Fe-4S binding protein [Parviterribacteraceae bacterium J379]
MPHVVTQSCVGDGSCVYACPVNCIQPTPDDPSFELAEMLHIDPTTCVDCGACVSACPVDAIKPHARLAPEELAFEAINAAFHREAPPRPLLAPVRPRLLVRDRGEDLRVAIVGSGPAALYAAEEVLTIPGALVSVYERQDRPYGLVHAGVAPDHRRTRRVSRQLDRIRAHPRLTMHLGVEIGRDLTHDRLLERHHAVIYAVGAASDRRLEIPGADLPGVLPATDMVAWYNGVLGADSTPVDLSHRRVVIVGNGNVALDIARILMMDPDALAGSDIAPRALEVLRASRVEEVVVAGRRGPEHAAFTLPELVGLTSTPGVSVRVVPEELAGAPAGPKVDLLRGLGSADGGMGRRITLRFGLTPQRVLGTERVTGIAFARTDAPGGEDLEAGMVVTAIGYRGDPVPALPFDAARGIVPNEDGRVVDPGTGAPLPGTYVAGWAKRGPSGFIGTNKGCSQDTVAALVDDHNAGLLRPVTSRR